MAAPPSAPPILYFWDDRVLYVGPGLPATSHSHHAIQICIPLSGELRLRAGPWDAWREYRGAVIAADARHESDVAVESLVAVWLDPGSREARGLRQARAPRSLAPLEEEELAALRPRLLRCWRQRWESSRAARLLDAVVRSLARRRWVDAEIDPRVARVAELARSGRHGRRWLPELAASVCLSPSRLEHLFTAEMGIPMRRYVLWQQLRRAARGLAAGSSVTEAAHAAGFSDTGHLSRTFRRFLGFAPSSAFSPQLSRIVQA